MAPAAPDLLPDPDLADVPIPDVSGLITEDDTPVKTWLRWCLPDGSLVPTGNERAEAERQRADRLAARLRELGIDPEG